MDYEPLSLRTHLPRVVVRRPVNRNDIAVIENLAGYNRVDQIKRMADGMRKIGVSCQRALIA